jgi:calcium/calmodulin-dependent protein kinase (CaM kinase) II
MTDPRDQELLDLTQRLLDAIGRRDWAAYQELCDPSLTAFEPEARGQLVEGLAFHQFYFEIGSAECRQRSTICSPRVRFAGDVAVVSYVRLNQHAAADGTPFTAAFEETRVWQRQGSLWKHVHFHRSAVPG